MEVIVFFAGQRAEASRYFCRKANRKPYGQKSQPNSKGRSSRELRRVITSQFRSPTSLGSTIISRPGTYSIPCSE